MKTIALSLAASLIASTSAFANGGILFDVNEAPINYNAQAVQSLDTERTASIGAAPQRSIMADKGLRFAKDKNPGLFDVDD